MKSIQITFLSLMFLIMGAACSHVEPLNFDIPTDSSYMKVQGDIYCYYQSSDKTTLIGPYASCLDEKLDLFARVQEQDRLRFVTIDRYGNVLNEIYMEDNEVDPVENGHYRIVKEGKLGLFSMLTGQSVVEPLYDWVSPVGDDLRSIACQDCKRSWDGNRVFYHGGQWGLLSSLGEWVIEPTYDAIENAHPEYVFLKDRQRCEIPSAESDLMNPALDTCYGEEYSSFQTAQK